MNRMPKIQILTFILFMINVIFSQKDIDDVIKYTLKLDRSVIHSGEVTTLIADIDLKKGYYIYSTHPEKSLSPSYVEWEDSSYFDLVGILMEPDPKIKYDANFDMEIGYHTSQLQFKQDLKISNAVTPGKYILKGTFIYQVCDPVKCIPHWDDFSLDINIHDGIEREKYLLTIKTEFDELKLDGDGNELDEVIEEGLFSFIIFALGMGFLALLTPCVFPMIPITVSFFTKMGEKENSSPIFSAIIYTIGIIVIFTGLGLILALTLGATGANQIASNPWVNLFIAALFVYFAFSLFGQYEIQLPSAFRQFSAQQENRGGILGILFMALTFTLTSFTCTVQFVGLLLVAASQGEFFWPIIGMVTFSSAFASPFFLLALFPQYLAKLPQSGGWLNSVKVVMGFLELGAAMKFLSNADLVWQWGVFTKQVVLSVWIVISIMMGLYLLGKIKLPHDSELKFISVPRLTLSIIFISFGLYLSAGLFGNSIHGLIDSYLPPEINTIDSNNKKSVNMIHSNWINDFEEGLSLAKNRNKPLFIDFTGYTCTNCRWMETNVFVDPNVKELFDQFVLVKLFTDGGPKYRENQKMEVERFGTSALPFYVVLSPGNEELDRFHGMDPDVGKFIAFLENALDVFKNKGT